MFRDHTYRVLLLGDRGVGKTSLVTRYIDKTFYEDTGFSDLNPYKVKSLNCGGSPIVDLLLWDIPGERINEESLADVHGVMLCYNTNDKDTFARLDHWHDLVDRHCNDMVLKVLVGTHSDLERKVDAGVAEELAYRLNIPQIVCSSKSGLNVKPAFKMMVKELLNNEYPWGKFYNMAIQLEDGQPTGGATDQSTEGDTTSITSLVSREDAGGWCCVIL